MIRKQKKNSKYKNMRAERLAQARRDETKVPSGRRYVLDGHTHTLGCGHAYCTVMELAAEAADAGLEMVCLTEHGPEMPGSITDMFFHNMLSIPPELFGVKIIKGMEANILDADGSIDASPAILPSLEILSASLHTPCFPPDTVERNTSALLGAIEKANVDFLCHLGNPQYPFDVEAVLQAAKRHDTMIEINNGSFYIRQGSRDRCVDIARRCRDLEIPVILGTDTHWAEDIGRFPWADRALTEADFPDELIINLDTKRLTDRLEAKGRKLGVVKKDRAVGLFDF